MTTRLIWIRQLFPTAVAALFALITFSSHADETITYIHWDAQGSPVAATDESGNVVWRESYLPYGERINNQAAASPHTRWYTGHPQDPDTGFVYAGARFYDPVIGRFLSVDPVEFQEDNLHSFNRYAYGNNNPYRYVDPDGRVNVKDAWRSGGASGGGPGAIENWGGIRVGVPVGSASVRGAPVGSGVVSGAGKGPHGAQVAKKAPNPHGSRGGPAHRNTIEHRIRDLKDQGHEHLGGGNLKEELIRTPGGCKSCRRPDITTRAPDGSIYRENVGRSTQTGKAISRERKALDDIEAATGSRPGYTPYDM